MEAILHSANQAFSRVVVKFSPLNLEWFAVIKRIKRKQSEQQDFVATARVAD